CGALMRRGSQIITGALVGSAMERIAWAGGRQRTLSEAERARLWRPHQTDNELSAAMGRILVARFAAYAGAHGRPDLARTAHSALAQQVALQSLKQHYWSGENALDLQGGARR